MNFMWFSLETFRVAFWSNVDYRWVGLKQKGHSSLWFHWLLITGICNPSTTIMFLWLLDTYIKNTHDTYSLLYKIMLSYDCYSNLKLKIFKFHTFLYWLESSYMVSNKVRHLLLNNNGHLSSTEPSSVVVRWWHHWFMALWQQWENDYE